MNRPNRIWLTVMAAICAIGLTPRAGSAEVIEIPEEIQISSQWCWAAVSDSILGYYGFEIEQCDIAEYTRQVATWHNYGTTYCCEKPTGQCNYWNYLWGYDGSVADILDHFGAIATEGVDAPLSIEDCQAQIASNRPFIVRWVWDTGGGHFVTGHGIEPDGTFYYMDPWYGEGSKISTWDWMVDGGRHTWTHTQKMNTSPCDCHAANECCDGCWILNESGACDADGSGCTSGDTCSAGTCVAGPAPDCSANDDQCNTGRCKSTGTDSFACVKNPAPFEGVGCNADNDGCTTGDVCAAGLCVPGQAADCSDGVGQCEEGVCISQGPEEHLCTTVTATMDGLACNDENLCTVDDICSAGECDGAEKDCSDNFACTITWCDPANGECAVETDQATCDDDNPCTTDVCTAQAGCDNTSVPEWLPCQGAGFACFNGRCDKLAENDTFGSPANIELDTPYYSERTKLHAYLEVPETCFGTATAGHDAFFRFTGEPGTAYRLTLTPDEGIMTALAVWNGTDEEALCTSGIETTDIEKTLVLPDDTTGGIILQVVFIDTLANDGPAGATIIVSAESGGDELPDVAEVSQVELAEEVHAVDAMDEGAVSEEMPDAGEETASTDLVVFHDAINETAAADATKHDDADTDPTGDLDSPDDVQRVDANADDGPTTPPHGNGSGCTAGSRGRLPATASLIFLVATAFAIPGLIRRRRNEGD